MSSFRPRLTLFDSNAGGEVIEVPAEGVLILGRAVDCALRLDSAAASKHHAKVYVHLGDVVIEDLASTNGTFVNGLRIDGRKVLEHGAVIGLGGPLVAPQRGAIVVHNAAEKLLAEMQLFEFAPDHPSELDLVEGSSEHDSQVEPRQETEETGLDSSLHDSELEEAASVAGIPRPWRSFERPRRSILAGVLLALALLASLGVWFTRQSSESRIWTQVRVAPASVQAFDRLVVTSPDIDAEHAYELLFGARTVVASEQLDGRLAVEVPRLAAQGSGEQAVMLEVKKQGQLLMRTSLIYDVVPEILGIQPAEARVGDVIRIEGVGFLPQKDAKAGTENARFVVTLGELEAKVLEATSETMTVRVPMVTRRKEVEVPVRVNLDSGEPLEARQFLRVAPRLAAPLDFKFSATFAPGLDAWQISSPLGAAFYLKEERNSTSSESERATAVCEAFNRLFRMAPDDETLRVDTITVNPGYALQVITGTGEKETLVEFTALDLETSALGGGSRVEPHILAFWQATVWNYVIDTFARGKPPVIDDRSPAYHRSLAWLVENNRTQGGFGRPEARDISQQADASREILSMVFLQPPRGFGDLSGAWAADLANVFYPTDDITVRLFLDLRHVAGDLTGQARLQFKDQVAFVRSFRARVRGTVQAGSPPHVVLRLAFEEPIGLVVFEGTARSLDLAGTFKAGSRLTGEWYASRVAEGEASSVP